MNPGEYFYSTAKNSHFCLSPHRPLRLGNSRLPALSLFDVSSSYSHQGQGQVSHFLCGATLVTLPCHPQPAPLPSLSSSSRSDYLY